MLYSLPDDIISLVFDKCCTRSLLGIALTNRALRSIVRIFAEDKLEILRDIVATARTCLPFAAGIATIYELKTICGQRIIVPSTFVEYVHRMFRDFYLDSIFIHHLAMEYIYMILTSIPVELHYGFLVNVDALVDHERFANHPHHVAIRITRSIRISHVKYATQLWARQEFAAKCFMDNELIKEAM